MAVDNPSQTDAGCTGDQTDGDCSCSWAYKGELSTDAGCTNSGTDDSPNWSCSGASTYETEGRCQDDLELIGVLGVCAEGCGPNACGPCLTGFAVPTPPRATPTHLLAAKTCSAWFDLSTVSRPSPLEEARRSARLLLGRARVRAPLNPEAGSRLASSSRPWWSRSSSSSSGASPLTCPCRTFLSVQASLCQTLLLGRCLPRVARTPPPRVKLAWRCGGASGPR